MTWSNHKVISKTRIYNFRWEDNVFVAVVVLIKLPNNVNWPKSTSCEEHANIFFCLQTRMPFMPASIYSEPASLLKLSIKWNTRKRPEVWVWGADELEDSLLKLINSSKAQNKRNYYR